MRFCNPNRSASDRRLVRSRRGLVLGVCKGLAGYLGLPALVVRAFVVVLIVVTGWVGVLFYLAGGLLIPLEPAEGRSGSGARDWLGPEAENLSRRTRDLDERIARMESHVTSREYDFDRRLRRS